MAAPTACITNSIILQPGTSFVLPPGSTLIGTSNISNLTSTCADLTKLEQSECYVLMLAGINGDNDGRSEYFEDGQQKIIGLNYNGVYISFGAGEIFNTSSGGTFNMSLLYDRIKQYISGTAFGNVNYFTASPNDSTRSSLAIKTIPSIANNLQVVLQAIANVSPGGGGSQVTFYSKFDKYSDLAASGVAGLPGCS